MSPKRIIVQLMSCSRIDDSRSGSVGFQVSGQKHVTPDQETVKLGFFVSGVKIITFQLVADTGIRTRIKWIPDGFEIREEIHPLNRGVGNYQRQNNIIFVDVNDSVVVMQGEPVIQENTFIGQIIRINWQNEEVHIFPHQKNSSFHCGLNPKNNRIDCLVK